MVKWDFREVRTANGKTELAELSAERKGHISRYEEALETAAAAMGAHPRYSNYFVKESIAVPGMEPVTGGNIEYGFCQALHAEEAAVAALRARYGHFDWTGIQAGQARMVRDNKDLVLGIIAGAPGLIASPCGNCRDILISEFGWEFEIVSGAAAGGTAVVATMQDYLHESYREMVTPQYEKKERRRWERRIEDALYACMPLENNAYEPQNYLRPGRIYYAVVETAHAKHYGAHDVMCEYHPIYALRDAVRQARRANDPFVRSVLIVADAGNLGTIGGTFPPHVMYKDRQHLAELNVQAELLRGEEQDPPVFLATYDGEIYRRLGKVVLKKTWQTSVKEWIPFVFTPKNFGEEFVLHLTRYYQNRGRR